MRKSVDVRLKTDEKNDKIKQKSSILHPETEAEPVESCAMLRT